MRFTVHDSPDYYNLKISVFNDDKKTDLIGESWINLDKVVVPGGGQIDIWHPLNCKNKYAGEVRIEMTYYDSRSKAEKPAEAQSDDHAKTTNVGQRSSLSGPRHETTPVKRRPLPSNPTGHSPSPQAQAEHLPRIPPSQSGSRNHQTPRSHPPDHTGRRQYDSHRSHDRHAHPDESRRYRPEIGPEYPQGQPSYIVNNSPTAPYHQPNHSPTSRYGHAQQADPHAGQADRWASNNESDHVQQADPHAGYRHGNANRHDVYQQPSPEPAYAASPAGIDNSSLPFALRVGPNKLQQQHNLTHSHSAPAVPHVEAAPPTRPHNVHAHSFHQHSRSDDYLHGNEFSQGAESYDTNEFHDSPSQQQQYQHHRNVAPSVSDAPVYSPEVSPSPNPRNSHDDRAMEYNSPARQRTTPVGYMPPTVEDEEEVPPPPPVHRVPMPSTTKSNTPSRHTYHADMHTNPTSPHDAGNRSSYYQDPAPEYRRQSEGPTLGSVPTQQYSTSLRNSTSTANIDDQYQRPQSKGMDGSSFVTTRQAPPPMFATTHNPVMAEMRGPPGQDNRITDPFAQASPSPANHHRTSRDHRSSLNDLDRRSPVPPYQGPGFNGSPARQQGASQQRSPVPHHTSSFDDYSANARNAPEAAPLIKPRATSPDTRPSSQHGRNIPARKSVSPQPSRLDQKGSSSSVPFSPDSYDAFNPVACSPISARTNSFNDGTAGSNKPNDPIVLNEPIIRSDGRVVDPSDHLPVEAWAPEPERKVAPKPQPIRVRVGLRGAQPMPASRRDAASTSPGTDFASPGGSVGNPSFSSSTIITPSSGGRTRLVKKARGQNVRQSVDENDVAYGGTSAYEPGLRGRPAQASAPAIPAKVPLPAAPAAAPEELLALSEEMKTIDIGSSSGAGGRVRRSRFGP